MRKTILTLIVCVSAMLQVKAQPFALALNRVDGSPFTCTLLEDLGIYKRLKVVANQNSTDGTWEFPALCSFPGNVYRPYTAGTAPIPFNAIIPPVPGTAAALYNSGNGGASGNLSPITNGRLYTFNIQNTFSATASPFFCVLETDYTPVTIPTVTQVPAVNAIGPDNVVEVTITCSAPPNPGENIFVRYTTNNFTSTSIAQASFIGSTGKATIPNFPFGTNVKYYVYSSSKSKALIESEAALHGEVVHDMSTLDWNTNIAQNYSYTVTNIVPVAMEYFRGQKATGGNELSWKITCSGSGQSTVTLERSADGRHFTGIYEATADLLRCQEPFRYTDGRPGSDIVHYRIKMKDESNRITYGPVLTIRDIQAGLQVDGPHPTIADNGRIMLQAVSDQQLVLNGAVADLTGKIIRRQSLRIVPGTNQLPLNVGDIPAGTYFLLLSNQSGWQKTLRFVIQ